MCGEEEGERQVPSAKTWPATVPPSVRTRRSLSSCSRTLANTRPRKAAFDARGRGLPGRRPCRLRNRASWREHGKGECSLDVRWNDDRDTDHEEWE